MTKREELLPRFEGRPAVVKHEGWTVYVAIRDAAYLQQLKAWKRVMREAHPDKGGTSAKFRAALARKLSWQHEEAAWYARLGLLPPDGYKQAKLLRARTLRLRGLKDDTRSDDREGQ